MSLEEQVEYWEKDGSGFPQFYTIPGSNKHIGMEC